MRIFTKFFKKSVENDHLPENFQPITGGDGTSLENAAVINCMSMGMANSLINKFISERHGTQDKDWNRSLEFFVVTPDVPSGNIRCISVEYESGSIDYYFNISKPMTGTLNLLEHLTK